MAKKGQTPPPGPPCDKCGQVHERDNLATCKAHRNDGTPCRSYPVHGARVCRLHGGAAPQVKAKAEERAFSNKLERVMRFSIGDPTPRHRGMSPEEHMLETLAQASQAVAILSGWVEDLNMPGPDEDAGPMADIVGVDDDGNPILRSQRFEFLGLNHQRDLAVHPLVTLLERWIDRRAKIAYQCAQVGISDRMVRLAESQAGLLIGVVQALLDGLDLSEADRARARRIVADRMRLVSAVDTTARPVTPG